MQPIYPMVHSIQTSFLTFFTAPCSARPLGAFRIGVALLALAQALLLSGHLLQLYGAFGYVQWSLTDAFAHPGVPRLSGFAVVLAPYGIDENGTVHLFFALYLVSLLALLAGWNTRVAALLAWFLHLTFIKSSTLTSYGVESFTHICLFYCVVLPVGVAYSVQYFLRNQPQPTGAIPRMGLRVLQIHLCIVYLTSGLGKAFGEQWWNGEAVWLALMQPQFSQMDMTWLATYPFLALLACWGTLVLEIGYCCFIWWPRTRVLWLLAIVFLHLQIALFLGLWLFSLLMIMMNLTVFGWPLLARERQPTQALFPTQRIYFEKGYTSLASVHRNPGLSEKIFRAKI